VENTEESAITLFCYQ